MSRRDALKLVASTVPALILARSRAAGAPTSPDFPKIAPGPFAGTVDSLKAYRCPDWFRDAKLGMWAHWGPQSAPGFPSGFALGAFVDKSAPVHVIQFARFV